MKRVSCKKLSAILAKRGIDKSPKLLRDSCEAYGRNVRCYINTGSKKERKSLESHLLSLGLNVNKKYWPESNMVDVGVTYFKAWHWVE